MSRRNYFTKEEFDQIKKLVAKKVLASKSEQKTIRDQIRKIGFHFSDYSSKKGYTVADLNELVKLGYIKIEGELGRGHLKTQQVPRSKSVNKAKTVGTTALNLAQLDFVEFQSLASKSLDETGFYFIRLKKSVKLPTRYQIRLDEREHNVIYIGKAEGQSLRSRLDQEVFHKRPGTFFRSIGAVLGFTPIPGHLIGNSNQNNYKFSADDTKAISDWLLKNTEFALITKVKDFQLEKSLIDKFSPLLNGTHNSKCLQELRKDRELCRKIARGVE